MKKTICLILLSIIALTSLSLYGENQVKPLDMPLKTFLRKAGKICGVYFTVEEGFENKYPDYILEKNISLSSTPTNIESAILCLTNSFKNLTIVVDSANKHIYHIIDSRLLSEKDYAMNQVLDSVKYNDTAHKYVDFLSEKALGLSNQNVHDIGSGEVVAANWVTKVSLEATNISVRDALSDGVNLQGYNRIIWASSASLETLKIKVQYQGPKPPLDP